MTMGFEGAAQPSRQVTSYEQQGEEEFSVCGFRFSVGDLGLRGHFMFESLHINQRLAHRLRLLSRSRKDSLRSLDARLPTDLLTGNRKPKTF